MTTQEKIEKLEAAQALVVEVKEQAIEDSDHRTSGPLVFVDIKIGQTVARIKREIRGSHSSRPG